MPRRMDDRSVWPLNAYCHLYHLFMTYRRVLDWMNGFIDTVYTTFGTTGNYSANTDLHTLQFNVAYALRLSVFTSRVLATDLSQSHCKFKSHMKFSLHCLIPLLPLFRNCQFRRLDSIQFLCSQAHILAGWRPETRLFTSAEHFLITTSHGPHRKYIQY
jgi:hypothetical protein